MLRCALTDTLYFDVIELIGVDRNFSARIELMTMLVRTVSTLAWIWLLRLAP